MGIRDDETGEIRCPIRGKPGVLLRVLGKSGVVAAVAAVIGAAAVALSPGLRQWLAGNRTPLIPVSVVSAPLGADVFIDEEPRGKTPTDARLTPGQHAIRVVLIGYRPWCRTFDPARTPELAATLEPLRLARLIVESEPGGADVLLDGEPRGATPITFRNLEAGSHTVRIENEPFYEAATRHVELKPCETRRLTIRLPSILETFCQDRIRKQPARLENYTALMSHYVKERRAQGAAATATKALQLLDAARTSATELRQFYAQLELVCSGRGAGMDDATREALLAAVLALFRRMAIEKPDEPEHYLFLVRILAKAGRFKKMLEACDEAAQRAPAARVVHVDIAEAYLGRGALEPAIALLQHATRLRPGHAHAHYRLGAAYHRCERHDDALREYLTAERLLADAPAENRSRLQIEIARLLAGKGDTAGAVGRYEKALGLEARAGRGVELTRGLIAHYSFDKDASDASGKGHHGENHGATLAAGGKSGGAFAFDGADDYVGIPARATRGLASSTFALWVKTTQAEAKPPGSYWTHPTLLGAATDGYGSGDLGLMLASGNVAYFHGLTPDGRDMFWSSAESVGDHKWHHIALVNAGPLVLLYVDGRLARGEAMTMGRGTARLGVVPDTSSGGSLGKAPLMIGACNMASGRSRAISFYRGLIDDVRIWNRALRAAEVAALCGRAK